MNCIKILAPIKDSTPTMRDLCFALMKDFGARVGGMPDEVEGQETYSNHYELFDPEKVRQYEIENLPHYWRKVWDKHNASGMGDCIRFRYRYVHVPIEILPQYPRVPCKGIFCLDKRSIRANKITANDLIFVGDEF